MEKQYYTCQYCKNDFTPKRRKVQKFCSDSCRVSYHRFKNVDLALKSTNLQIKSEDKVPNKIKVDQVSTAGVANAAIGSGLADLLISALTPEENKPATKGDILKLSASLKRYHQIKNLPPNLMGQFPYFDLHTNTLVYLGNRLPFKS
jgi:hypothetical protein